MALMEATKPPVKAVGERRFAPKADGPLQTTGPLSRQMVLDFTGRIKQELTSEESLELLKVCSLPSH